jgi:AraC-like DNA-binding protein
VQLIGHLLIVVNRGSVLLETDRELVLLRRGDVCVVPAGQYKITEVAAPSCRHGEIHYFFFNTAVLRDKLLPIPLAEQIALRAGPLAPEPGVMKAVLPVLMAGMRLRQQPFPRAFSVVLTFLINRLSSEMISFVAREFSIPRLRLNLYMEHALTADPLRAGEDYPGGKNALIRDLRIFQGTTPDQWLRKRKMELARLWIAHAGATAETLARNFGYAVSDFASDFRQYNRVPVGRIQAGKPWQELTRQERTQVTTPFWLPVDFQAAQREQAAAEEYLRDVYCWLSETESPADVIARFRLDGRQSEDKDSRQHSQPGSSADKITAEQNFWNTTATAPYIANLIRVQFGRDFSDLLKQAA